MKQMNKHCSHCPVNIFTEAEYKRLKKDYTKYREAGKLKILAKEMGRSWSSITDHASQIGLGNPFHPRPYLAKWKYMKEEEARKLMNQFKKSAMAVVLWCKVQRLNHDSFSRTMKRFFPDEYELAVESNHPQETRYRRGRRFEYKCRNELQEYGYFVLRSPASKGPVDLVAIAKGFVLFIQCKRSGSMGPDEWNTLFDLANSVGAIPVLAVRSGWKTIEYTQLMGRKDRNKRFQPHELIDPEVLINGKPFFGI